MAKNVFQDMVKTKRERATLTKPVTFAQKMEKIEQVKKMASRLPPENTHTTGGRKYGLWIVALGSVVFFLFALSFFFAHANVTVTPRATDVVFNENLSANKDSSVSDGVSFDLVVISGEETRTVSATEQKDVSIAAKGTVVIYNAFSKVAQPLLIDTRLEGSNGKIYKTVKAVTVSGIKADGTPGSVEVDIYAQDPGPASNSEPLDFKVFGFKGTPKYEKFYARSKGNITGGQQGNVPVVSEEEKSRLSGDMKNALESSLLHKATDQIPNGFILFKDATFLVTDTDTPEAITTEEGTILSLKGTMYGFLFNEEKLTEKITKGKISEYDGAQVYIPNIGDLVFSLSNKGIPFSEVSSINFTLSGKAKVVWKFDGEKLKTDLAGKSKKYFNQALAEYPYIESGELKLSPFWSGTIPEKLKDITVTVNYPQ